MRTEECRRRKVIRACILAAVATLAAGGPPAWAEGNAVIKLPWAQITRSDAHCASEGIDLNQALSVSERIVFQPFCYQVNAGERYIPLLYWYTDTSYANAPSRYPLAGEAPMEDFLAKVAGVRYVIDPGTRQERNYQFSAQDVLELRTFDQVASTAPALPVAIFLAKLPPLPPGGHSFQGFVEMSAGHCDGLGTAPGNCLPAGETRLTWCPFEVLDGALQPHE